MAWRGSKQRHRSARQKRAVWMSRYGSMAMNDRYSERRAARMKGNRKPKLYTPHPLEQRQ